MHHPTFATKTPVPTTQTAPLTFRFVQKLAEIAADWEAAAPADNRFLQREYLSVLEQNPPVGMRFSYLVFYQNERPVGVAYCQIKHFRADENIRDHDVNQATDPCFFDGLFRWMRRRFAGMVSADVLICGNMLLTGENAYHFDYQRVSIEKAMRWLEIGIEAIIAAEEKRGVKIPAILHKDLREINRRVGIENWVSEGFVEFDIQPCMVFHRRPEWRDFEDYVAAMGKKYRTRTKRAFKKRDGIVCREMQADEIENHLPRIYELYRAIAKNAGFNMVDLNENYLRDLKMALPEAFRLHGYFLDGELIAFFTTIENGPELEAHFLGYDGELNHDFQIYLNILYEIVRLGFDGNFQKINFSRTALEIKSSIGAVAEEMFCYLRQQNSFANLFTERALDFLKPVEKWTPRHPFGEEDVLENIQTT